MNVARKALAILSLVAAVAVIMGYGSIPLSGVERRILYMGVDYATYPVNRLPEVDDYINLTSLRVHDPLDTIAFAQMFKLPPSGTAARDIRFVYWQPVDCSHLLDENILRTDLSLFRSKITSSGLLSQLAAIQLGEEIGNRFYTGYFDPGAPQPFPCAMAVPGTYRQRMDWIRDRLAVLIAVVKESTLFPSTPVVLMDTIWNTSPNYPDLYYRPFPSNVDVLALDAYVRNPGLCSQSQFANDVAPYYMHAAQYGKDMLMYAQAFDAPGSEWTPMPHSDCFDRFYDLAQDTAKVAGILWYAWQWPTAGANGVGALNAQQAYIYPTQVSKLAQIFSYNWSLP